MKIVDGISKLNRTTKTQLSLSDLAIENADDRGGGPVTDRKIKITAGNTLIRH